MLHLMLLNECFLHYFSFMRVIIMVISVCVNDTVHFLYVRAGAQNIGGDLLKLRFMHHLKAE